MTHCPELQAAIDQWRGWTIDQRRASPHTVTAYSLDVDAFLRFLAHFDQAAPDLARMARLTRGDFRAWLSALAVTGLMPASRARSLAAVRSAFRYWARAGIVTVPALDTIRAPKIGRRLPRPMARDDIDRVLMALRDRQPDWMGLRDYAFAMLLYGCGLRISEGIALNREPLGSEIRVLGKGGRMRVVPVLPRVAAAVAAYCAACPFKGPALFVGPLGRRMIARAFQARFSTVRHALGLPDTATPHALRHSFGTHMHSAGADLRAVQELMGHVSISSTQIYTEIDPEALLRAYAKGKPG